MRKTVLLLLTLALLLLNPLIITNSYSENKIPTVNVLTWWGYLDNPDLIARTEKACNVKLSHDVYYSNDEFLRRWRGSEENYDIIIFTESIYKSVETHLPKINSPLWEEAYNYNPIIRSHYFNKQFPHNVVYYAHALTGFMWNKSLIKINSTDTFQQIFSQTIGHTIALIDDPLEINILLGSAVQQINKNSIIDNNTPKFDRIESLTKNSKIIPINNYHQLSNQKDLAVIFTWSGEAIETINNKKSNEQSNWEFTINKNLSQISSDLLAQTSNSLPALCVAKQLTSQAEMNYMQNNSYYFSPYLDSTQVKNSIFKTIYKNFIRLLPNLKWLSSLNSDESDKLNTSWALTKNRLAREIND